MIAQDKAHPRISTREEWLTERKQLLTKEKALTREQDRLNAERRRLPMVKLDKDYVFEGLTGKVRLVDLFEGRTQLVVYHFMFGPEDEKACMGCTGFVDALGSLDLLAERDTTFTLISRAPFERLEALKRAKFWTVSWYSSFGSDFNYDFHVTHDINVAPIEYNYSDEAALHARRGPEPIEGEDHGMSVFFRMGDDVYHTYSSYARGVEKLADTYAMLDITPYGRQEDWEDSPPGTPQSPTYG